MNNIQFLEPDQVLRMHDIIVDAYGGLLGVRDMDLLDSALAEPRATLGGNFLYPTIHLMASAYIYHLIKNHPFLDGNKRIGVATGLLFLKLNSTTGANLDWRCGAMHKLALKVATSELTKNEMAQLLMCFEEEFELNNDVYY